MLIFLAFVIQFVFSLGNRERETVVQVSGVVRLVGFNPFPELVITDDEFDWYIAREEMNKLHDLQHRAVTIEGRKTITELFFANGMSAGIRRELSNIRIITIY